MNVLVDKWVFQLSADRANQACTDRSPVNCKFNAPVRGLVQKPLFLLVLLAATVLTAHGQAGFQFTNGPAVLNSSLEFVTNLVPPSPANSYRTPPTNLPLEVRRAMLAFVRQATLQVTTITNGAFDHFLPESLHNHVWTNLIAHTNDRSMVIWNVRTHPSDWPAHPPVAEWNPNGLMAGMKGLTALSPCWEGEGLSGQVPITALTRRHGYTRGHSMGPDGFRTNFGGKKIWFVAANNQLVEVKATREVVRTMLSGRDYTILLFDRDLPSSIQPLRVVGQDLVFRPKSKYPLLVGTPNPLFQTEQSGNVSADLPGFTCNTWKGGDSGSPNLLPLPGELIFCNGRATSGASPEMQQDMDELCRLEGLDPVKYQLQQVDLSSFPTY